MPVYFSFLIFLSAFTVIDFHYSNRQCVRYGLLFCGVFLITIAGFRFHCGPDYDAYLSIYKGIISNRNTVLLEAGFIYVNKLFGVIGSFRLMLLCIAALSITLKLVFFFRESELPFLSILLYFIGTFLSQDFGLIRQGLALSFALLAFTEAYKRNFIRFVLLFLLAMAFHYTAFVIFPFYWVGKIKLTKFRAFLLLLASVVFSIFFLQILDYIVPMLNIHYVNMQFNSYRDRRFVGELSNFISLMITHLPVLLVYYIGEKKLLSDGKSRYYFQLYVWGTCMTIAFMPVPEIALRGTAYFEILYVILLPNIVKIIKPNGRFVFCIMLMCLVLAKFLFTNHDMPDFFIPYQINFNIFEN